MLTLENIVAGYGESQVLNGISFGVGASQVVTLLGRNGMGKTTTVRAIMGLIRPSAGHIRFDGAEITGAAPYRIAQRGIGLVPEGRQIFPTLSVEENLIATAANRMGGTPRWDLPAIYALFPRLAERRFVLDPLVMVAPDWRHPVTGHSARQLHARALRPKGLPRA